MIHLLPPGTDNPAEKETKAAQAPKKKKGRPKVELPVKEFENLCALQCTKEEIAGFFEVDEKTLNAWCKRTYGKTFSLVFADKRTKGKISLRRNQFELSKRDSRMAIWLGRNWLDQTDRDPDTGEDDGGVQIIDDL